MGNYNTLEKDYCATCKYFSCRETGYAPYGEFNVSLPYEEYCRHKKRDECLWGDHPDDILLEESGEFIYCPYYYEQDEYLEFEGSEDDLDFEKFKKLGEKIGIDWNVVEFTVEDFIKGYNVELEHGTVDDDTNITDDDLEITAKIAWAHLKEMPDYYTLLKNMEKGGKK